MRCDVSVYKMFTNLCAFPKKTLTLQTASMTSIAIPKFSDFLNKHFSATQIAGRQSFFYKRDSAAKIQSTNA